ncbi:MAG: tRNA uridine-5-carboxymethylaminomethyl(34) synthesis GTPase MnmE [Rhodospirillales bacterium]|nr:tRNA uridine-5-carboxymethylaminomethyl(34) synthesis GTPase MnmE [Rhodospirillales bacterium]
MTAETIFAPSTGAGPAGLAVIRVSGPAAGAALAAVTGRDLPQPRRATMADIKAADGTPIDSGLVLWFPGPASFTGEDVAELHLHGGRAVVAATLEALGSCPGLRLAEPGEFTRRAFEAGKLDLTEAEGLADLINAETEAQRHQALRQMQGGLSDLYEDWRQRLLNTLAHMEAEIDFSDEDLPDGVAAEARRDIADLAAEIDAHLADDHRGERLRDGIHLAIIGPPNAGKSSLLNLLARRDAAIVSATAGTTRDVIEVHLDLGGYPVVVADTAGLREAEADDIEAEGVRRARLRAQDADLKLAVLDGQDWPEADPVTAALVDGDTIAVINKSDLKKPDGNLQINDRPVLTISVKTGDGIDGLLEALGREVAGRFPAAASPALTRARHREALEDCRESLARTPGGQAIELETEDLRLAVRALGRITGRVDVEDLLDVIFQDFCIGK